ncbi:MAG: hypothetical protein KAX93_07955 [Flavobacterium sp.]|nr:hypothetical protein [Flavobacterium sp.]MBP8158296.1 hypothetical protein [Flavobacterium sp.]
MRKYYSILQMVLILVLLSATVYSLVAYKNETDFNAKLQLVEAKVKKKFCDASIIIKRRKGKNDQSSILVSYKSKDYWIHHYSLKECDKISDKVKLYYHPEEDDFYKLQTSNSDKVFLFAILALVSLTPLNLLSSKMDQKAKKKKKK